MAVDFELIRFWTGKSIILAGRFVCGQFEIGIQVARCWIVESIEPRRQSDGLWPRTSNESNSLAAANCLKKAILVQYFRSAGRDKGKETLANVSCFPIFQGFLAPSWNGMNTIRMQCHACFYPSFRLFHAWLGHFNVSSRKCPAKMSNHLQLRGYANRSVVLSTTDWLCMFLIEKDRRLGLCRDRNLERHKSCLSISRSWISADFVSTKLWSFHIFINLEEGGGMKIEEKTVHQDGGHGGG